MIEAVKEIGEYSLEKAGRRLEDPTDIVIEDPATNDTYKHILGIKINKTEKGFEYAGIELEEYSKSKTKQYLYKQGAARGTDLTPTGRVTEIDKTFTNKILLWFTNITDENQIVFEVLISAFHYRNHFNLPDKINSNGNRPYLQKNR